MWSVQVDSTHQGPRQFVVSDASGNTVGIGSGRKRRFRTERKAQELADRLNSGFQLCPHCWKPIEKPRS